MSISGANYKRTHTERERKRERERKKVRNCENLDSLAVLRIITLLLRCLTNERTASIFLVKDKKNEKEKPVVAAAPLLSLLFLKGWGRKEKKASGEKKTQSTKSGKRENKKKVKKSR